jgi:hypothetical protein
MSFLSLITHLSFSFALRIKDRNPPACCRTD